MLPDPSPSGDPLAGPRLQAEINMTPFIDVMLVLLIIFMVAAPLMVAGVPLSLPQTSAQAVPPAQKPLVVSVTGDGQVFLAEQPIQPEQIPALVAPMIQNAPDTGVYVRGDGAVDYAVMVRVLAQLGQAGAVRVSLLTENQAVPDGPAH